MKLMFLVCLCLLFLFNSSVSSLYPSDVVFDYLETDLTSGVYGFTCSLCWNSSCSSTTYESYMSSSSFESLCNVGSSIFVGVKSTYSTSTVLMGAFAPFSTVIPSTVNYTVGHTVSYNNVSWYYTPGYSMGFSISSVALAPMDYLNTVPKYRLSWTLTNSTINTQFYGGCRVGSYGTVGYRGMSTAYEKVIYSCMALPTSQPTSVPTGQPSRIPTSQPSVQPTSRPSGQPTRLPTSQPSSQPTTQPTGQPTHHPTCQPSSQPTHHPSSQPASSPTSQPSSQPSCQPTCQPFSHPSSRPSSQPISHPSSHPTGQPSIIPTSQPFGHPSSQPSSQPTRHPSGQPSHQPTNQPTGQPSLRPSGQPTRQPSAQPTGQPTGQPSSIPSRQPSSCPSSQPSRVPSSQPSTAPTSIPTTSFPTSRPSVGPTKYPSTSRPTTLGTTNEPTPAPTSHPTAVYDDYRYSASYPQFLRLQSSLLSTTNLASSVDSRQLVFGIYTYKGYSVNQSRASMNDQLTQETLSFSESGSSSSSSDTTTSWISDWISFVRYSFQLPRKTYEITSAQLWYTIEDLNSGHLTSQSIECQDSVGLQALFQALAEGKTYRLNCGEEMWVTYACPISGPVLCANCKIDCSDLSCPGGQAFILNPLRSDCQDNVRYYHVAHYTMIQVQLQPVVYYPQWMWSPSISALDTTATSTSTSNSFQDSSSVQIWGYLTRPGKLYCRALLSSSNTSSSSIQFTARNFSSFFSSPLYSGSSMNLTSTSVNITWVNNAHYSLHSSYGSYQHGIQSASHSGFHLWPYNYTQVWWIEVTLSSLAPGVAYDVYCGTQDYRGNFMPWSETFANRTTVITNGSPRLQFASNNRTALISSSTANYVDLTSYIWLNSFVQDSFLSSSEKSGIALSVLQSSSASCPAALQTLQATSAVDVTPVVRPNLIPASLLQQPNQWLPLQLRLPVGCYEIHANFTASPEHVWIASSATFQSEAFHNSFQIWVYPYASITDSTAWWIDPQILSAQLSQDGSTLLVKFTVQTDQGQSSLTYEPGTLNYFSCDQLFRFESSNSNGTTFCRWISPSQVLLWYPTSTTIFNSTVSYVSKLQPGQIVTLRSGVLQINCSVVDLSCIEEGPGSTQVLITSMLGEEPLRPKASLIAPSSSLLLCQGITLDPTASTGQGSRSWKSVSWQVEVVASGNISNSLCLSVQDRLLQYLNSNYSLDTSQRIILPSSWLMAPCRYQFLIEVMNFWGYSDRSGCEIELTHPENQMEWDQGSLVPQIRLSSPSSLSLSPSQAYDILAEVDFASISCMKHQSSSLASTFWNQSRHVFTWNLYQDSFLLKSQTRPTPILSEIAEFATSLSTSLSSSSWPWLQQGTEGPLFQITAFQWPVSTSYTLELCVSTQLQTNPSSWNLLTPLAKISIPISIPSSPSLVVRIQGGVSLQQIFLPAFHNTSWNSTTLDSFLSYQARLNYSKTIPAEAYPSFTSFYTRSSSPNYFMVDGSSSRDPDDPWQSPLTLHTSFADYQFIWSCWQINLSLSEECLFTWPFPSLIRIGDYPVEGRSGSVVGEEVVYRTTSGQPISSAEVLNSSFHLQSGQIFNVTLQIFNLKDGRSGFQSVLIEVQDSVSTFSLVEKRIESVNHTLLSTVVTAWYPYLPMTSTLAAASSVLPVTTSSSSLAVGDIFSLQVPVDMDLVLVNSSLSFPSAYRTTTSYTSQLSSPTYSWQIAWEGKVVQNFSTYFRNLSVMSNFQVPFMSGTSLFTLSLEVLSLPIFPSSSFSKLEFILTSSSGNTSLSLIKVEVPINQAPRDGSWKIQPESFHGVAWNTSFQFQAFQWIDVDQDFPLTFSGKCSFQVGSNNFHFIHRRSGYSFFESFLPPGDSQFQDEVSCDFQVYDALDATSHTWTVLYVHPVSSDTSLTAQFLLNGSASLPISLERSWKNQDWVGANLILASISREISLADCQYAPSKDQCQNLYHRQPCYWVPGVCGPCLAGYVSPDPDYGNSTCLSDTTSLADFTSYFTRPTAAPTFMPTFMPTVNTSRSNVSSPSLPPSSPPSLPLPPLKTCLHNCSNVGQCVIRDQYGRLSSSSSSSSSSFCPWGDWTCQVECQCSPGYFGVDCSLTNLTYHNLHQQHTRIFQAIYFLYYMQDLTVDTADHFVSSLLSHLQGSSLLTHVELEQGARLMLSFVMDYPHLAATDNLATMLFTGVELILQGGSEVTVDVYALLQQVVVALPLVVLDPQRVVPTSSLQEVWSFATPYLRCHSVSQGLSSLYWDSSQQQPKMIALELPLTSQEKYFQIAAPFVQLHIQPQGNQVLSDIPTNLSIRFTVVQFLFQPVMTFMNSTSIQLHLSLASTASATTLPASVSAYYLSFFDVTMDSVVKNQESVQYLADASYSLQQSCLPNPGSSNHTLECPTTQDSTQVQCPGDYGFGEFTVSCPARQSLPICQLRPPSWTTTSTTSTTTSSSSLLEDPYETSSRCQVLDYGSENTTCSCSLSSFSALTSSLSMAMTAFPQLRSSTGSISSSNTNLVETTTLATLGPSWNTISFSSPITSLTATSSSSTSSLTSSTSTVLLLEISSKEKVSSTPFVTTWKPLGIYRLVPITSTLDFQLIFAILIVFSVIAMIQWISKDVTQWLHSSTHSSTATSSSSSSSKLQSTTASLYVLPRRQIAPFFRSLLPVEFDDRQELLQVWNSKLHLGHEWVWLGWDKLMQAWILYFHPPLKNRSRKATTGNTAAAVAALTTMRMENGDNDRSRQKDSVKDSSFFSWNNSPSSLWGSSLWQRAKSVTIFPQDSLPPSSTPPGEAEDVEASPDMPPARNEKRRTGIQDRKTDEREEEKEEEEEEEEEKGSRERAKRASRKSAGSAKSRSAQTNDQDCQVEPNKPLPGNLKNKKDLESTFEDPSKPPVEEAWKGIRSREHYWSRGLQFLAYWWFNLALISFLVYYFEGDRGECQGNLSQASCEAMKVGMNPYATRCQWIPSYRSCRPAPFSWYSFPISVLVLATATLAVGKVGYYGCQYCLSVILCYQGQEFLFMAQFFLKMLKRVLPFLFQTSNYDMGLAKKRRKRVQVLKDAEKDDSGVLKREDLHSQKNGGAMTTKKTEKEVKVTVKVAEKAEKRKELENEIENEEMEEEQEENWGLEDEDDYDYDEVISQRQRSKERSKKSGLALRGVDIHPWKNSPFEYGDELKLCQTLPATFMRGVRLMHMKREIDFVSPLDEIEIFLKATINEPWRCHRNRLSSASSTSGTSSSSAPSMASSSHPTSEKESNSFLAAFKYSLRSDFFARIEVVGDPEVAADMVNHCQASSRHILVQKVVKARRFCEQLKKYMKSLEDVPEEVKDRFVLKWFLMDMLPPTKRAIVKHYLFGDFLTYLNRRRVGFPAVVALTALVSAYILLSLVLSWYFLSSLGAHAFPLWIATFVWVVVEDWILLQPALIGLQQVAIPWLARSEFSCRHEALAARAEGLLRRRLYRSFPFHGLFHHFHPVCRLARNFPALSSSRLLLSLTDYDLPIPYHWRLRLGWNEPPYDIQSTSTSSPLFVDRFWIFRRNMNTRLIYWSYHVQHSLLYLSILLAGKIIMPLAPEIQALLLGWAVLFVLHGAALWLVYCWANPPHWEGLILFGVVGALILIVKLEPYCRRESDEQRLERLRKENFRKKKILDRMKNEVLKKGNEGFHWQDQLPFEHNEFFLEKNVQYFQEAVQGKHKTRSKSQKGSVKDPLRANTATATATATTTAMKMSPLLHPSTTFDRNRAVDYPVNFLDMNLPPELPRSVLQNSRQLKMKKMASLHPGGGGNEAGRENKGVEALQPRPTSVIRPVEGPPLSSFPQIDSYSSKKGNEMRVSREDFGSVSDDNDDDNYYDNDNNDDDLDMENDMESDMESKSDHEWEKEQEKEKDKEKDKKKKRKSDQDKDSKPKSNPKTKTTTQDNNECEYDHENEEMHSSWQKKDDGDDAAAMMVGEGPLQISQESLANYSLRHLKSPSRNKNHATSHLRRQRSEQRGPGQGRPEDTRPRTSERFQFSASRGISSPSRPDSRSSPSSSWDPSATHRGLNDSLKAATTTTTKIVVGPGGGGLGDHDRVVRGERSRSEGWDIEKGWDGIPNESMIMPLTLTLKEHPEMMYLPHEEDSHDPNYHPIPPPEWLLKSSSETSSSSWMPPSSTPPYSSSSTPGYPAGVLSHPGESSQSPPRSRGPGESLSPLKPMYKASYPLWQ